MVVEMKTEWPFLQIPEAFAALMGAADEGTRIYRAEGDHAAMQRWFDALCEYIGPCVSPGGAAVYAGVSRAGVYKRMKAGEQPNPFIDPKGYAEHIDRAEKKYLDQLAAERKAGRK